MNIGKVYVFSNVKTIIVFVVEQIEIKSNKIIILNFVPPTVKTGTEHLILYVYIN